MNDNLRYDTPEVVDREYLTAGEENPAGMMRWVVGAIVLFGLLILTGIVRADEWQAPPVGMRVGGYVHVQCGKIEDANQFLDIAAEDWQTAIDYLVQSAHHSCIGSTMPFMLTVPEPIRVQEDAEQDIWRVYNGMVAIPGLPFLISGYVLLVEVTPKSDA